MITHIVLLKPKAETTPAEMQQVLAQVQALQQQIPGIVDIQVGENLSMSHHIGFIDTEKSEQIKEVFFQPSFYSLWDFPKT